MADETEHPVKPLTVRQERRLTNALEERFLDLTRNSKKRTDESSTMRTLSSYLQAATPLLSLILQTPPAGPSAPLRTAFLLRYTGDTLGTIPAYIPEPETVPMLERWLDVLDCGWLAVLQRQRWDPNARKGVGPNQPSQPASVTERTRLRSLLLVGTEALAEWLERTRKFQHEDQEDEETVQLSAFDNIFERTLRDIGTVGGDGPQTTELIEPELLLQAELNGDGDMLAFDDIDEDM